MGRVKQDGYQNFNNSLILLAMSSIVLRLSFYIDSFDIEYPKKANMPLNKETKSNLI